MFGSQTYTMKRLYVVAQTDRAGMQLEHVVNQCAGLILSDTIVASAYFGSYILGMLDSITSVYEAQTRQRIGLSLHEQFFVQFIKKHGISSRGATAAFRKILVQKSHGEFAAGIRDGYQDGAQYLSKRVRPMRLRDYIKSWNDQAVSVASPSRDNAPASANAGERLDAC